MSSTNNLKIAISGGEGLILHLCQYGFNKVLILVLGGPAGLTLARILQANGISCTVYELDSSRDARGQGGSLDLHPETGQLALREAGLSLHTLFTKLIMLRN
jgi:hypothetical protein